MESTSECSMQGSATLRALRCSNKERLLTDMAEVFANLVQGQLHHLFSWLCSTIEDYCDGVGAMVENVAGAEDVVDHPA